VPLRPRIVPVPPPAAYDQTRVILISHAHQDHLDRRTLERFSPGVVILCPAPAARYLHALDRDVRIMRPGESYAIPGGRIVAVSALHPGGRYGIHATRNGDALGWVIETQEHTIYYSGDTGYFDGFANVGRTYQPDVALLNVNAHLHSEDALAAAVDLGMPTIVPLHYGAYWSPKEKKSSGWRAQLADWLGPEMHAVGVGQSWALDAAASRYDSSSARPESLAPPAIARFAVIDSGLARGARPSAAAVTDLAHRGYRTVVSLVHDPAEEARVRAAGMAYVEIPMSATMFGASVPSDHDLERFFDVVLDSTARPVYMHCVHGKDRTGAMAALYRIEVLGWSSEKALAEMDRMGFNGWYRNLRRFVRDYEPRGYAARRKVAGAE
ncbi:MAG TPA: MBL fold metallo-hydrolase, partial [Candidatus Eisenbacteria bacterium]|nr:MBL fold metallo-hydrolase [Candidatus Eisenbacteria bacterium]